MEDDHSELIAGISIGLSICAILINILDFLGYIGKC